MNQNSNTPVAEQQHRGLDLLQELDRRQESVLQELDELNQRVERVLALYLEGRQSRPGVKAEIAAHETQHTSVKRAA